MLTPCVAMFTPPSPAFTQGFYHADPHPGNLLKTRDGRLAYLDFGMMGEIDVGVRQALIRATLHLVNREYGALAADFVALGLLPPGSDMGAIIPALTGVWLGRREGSLGLRWLCQMRS
jgi:aarF domain-containing kinase